LSSITLSAALRIDDVGDESRKKKEDSGLEVRDDLPAVVLNHMQTVYPLELEQLQQLLGESVRSLRGSLQAAEQAAARHDLSALASAAHKAKGTLLGLGLAGQVNAAKELEVSAKNNEELDFALLVAQLTNSLHSLLEMNI
jgi:HPt (histidine-containing phosphotransfer) domain-containing protein